MRVIECGGANVKRYASSIFVVLIFLLLLISVNMLSLGLDAREQPAIEKPVIEKPVATSDMDFDLTAVKQASGGK
jgi:hypothetical protein